MHSDENGVHMQSRTLNKAGSIFRHPCSWQQLTMTMLIIALQYIYMTLYMTYRIQYSWHLFLDSWDGNVKSGRDLLKNGRHNVTLTLAGTHHPWGTVWRQSPAAGIPAWNRWVCLCVYLLRVFPQVRGEVKVKVRSGELSWCGMSQSYLNSWEVEGVSRTVS